MVDGTPPATAPRLAVLDLASGRPARQLRQHPGRHPAGRARRADRRQRRRELGARLLHLYGSHIDFDVATLSALYPKHSDYVSAVSAATKANQKSGFLLGADVAGTRNQADRSFIGYGYACGAVCRMSQTLRVLTDGALIPDADKLLRSIDDATFALASGDGRAPAAAPRRRTTSGRRRRSRSTPMMCRGSPRRGRCRRPSRIWWPPPRHSSRTSTS